MHVQRMQQLLSPRHDNEAGLCVIQEVVVCAMEAIPKMLRLRVSALEDGRHFLKQIRHLNATTAWDAQHTHVTHTHAHTHARHEYNTCDSDRLQSLGVHCGPRAS